jgi:hypothetical protein
MKSRTIIPLRGSVTLRRHVVALVPRLLPRMLLGLVLPAAGLLRHNIVMMIAGVAVTIVLVALQIAAWRIFMISVRYDRIRIRYFRLGIQQVTYPIPGLRGLTCKQHPVGMLWDVGTLILILPDKTLRFTMLTPYSLLNDALGW